MKIVIKPMGTVVLMSVTFVACAAAGLLLRGAVAKTGDSGIPLVGSEAALAQKMNGGKILLKCPDCGATFSTTVPELADLVLPDALRGDPNIRSYPAEEAQLKGAVTRITGSLPGYLGSGFVEFPNKSGDSVTFSVTAPTDGDYMVAFRYANPTPDGQICRVVKQSGEGAEEVIVPTLAFPRTTRQRNWDYVSLQTHLSVGKNIIRIGTTGTGGPVLDGMVIVPVTETGKTPNGAKS